MSGKPRRQQTTLFNTAERFRAWMELQKVIEEAPVVPPCTNAPDLFFVGQAESYYSKQALRLCRESCPIKHECGQYALEFREDEGIWGGMTASERRKIRLKMRGAH